jgi:hypothetical protein
MFNIVQLLRCHTQLTSQLPNFDGPLCCLQCARAAPLLPAMVASPVAAAASLAPPALPRAMRDTVALPWPRAGLRAAGAVCRAHVTQLVSLTVGTMSHVTCVFHAIAELRSLITGSAKEWQLHYIHRWSYHLPL